MAPAAPIQTRLAAKYASGPEEVKERARTFADMLNRSGRQTHHADLTGTSPRTNLLTGLILHVIYAGTREDAGWMASAFSIRPDHDQEKKKALHAMIEHAGNSRDT